METIWLNVFQIVIFQIIEGTLFFADEIWHRTSVHQEGKWD